MVDVSPRSTTALRLLRAMVVIAVLLSTFVVLAVFLVGFGRAGG